VTFEDRIAAVADEMKRSGSGDSIVERAMYAAVFPVLRKHARANPEGMRAELAGIIAKIVALLDLTPGEIFPGPEAEPPAR